MKRRKKRGISPLFLVLLAGAVCLVWVSWNNFSSGRETYEQLTHTPVPTPTTTPWMRDVSITRDPAQVTFTPAPTAILIQSGASGSTVSAIQQRLKDLGYLTGAVDGQFGSGTKSAVVAFQLQHGLDGDGIVGEKTYAMLFSDSAQMMQATPTPQGTVVTGGSLPMLVNRQHTVASDFYPADLVTLKDYMPSGLCTIKGSEIQGVREAVDALIEMFTAAKADGIDNFQISAGYRSYAYQKKLFDNKVSEFEKNGSSHSSAVSSARVTVADPGASEHHTGLAFDITVPNTSQFLGTKQCTWMHEHCWEYGFILRYTTEKEKITGYTGEAWHFRYVGVEHSMAMKQSGECLEEYIERMSQ